TFFVDVDRLFVRETLGSRLADSLETALRLADGIVTVEALDGGDGSARASSRPPSSKAGLKDPATTNTTTFSERLACAECGISFPEISPRMFSFNNPYGACPECGGIGSPGENDPDRLVAEPARAPQDGAPPPAGGGAATGFPQTPPGPRTRHQIFPGRPGGASPRTPRR